MRVKKKEDGHYYERVVTWEDEPSRGMFGSSLFLMMFVTLGIIYSLSYPESIGTPGEAFFMGMLAVVVFLFATGFLIISIGHGKKVVYRRIK